MPTSQGGQKAYVLVYGSEAHSSELLLSKLSLSSCEDQPPQGSLKHGRGAQKQEPPSSPQQFSSGLHTPRKKHLLFTSSWAVPAPGPAQGPWMTQ